MAELKIYLSEELDKRFRMLAMTVFGYGRGSLSEAAVNALTRWCEEHEAHKLDLRSKNEESRISGDPATRAEERPRIVAATKGEDSSSASPLC